VRPINDQIIIEEVKEEEKTVGQIVIPATVAKDDNVIRGKICFVNPEWTTANGVTVKSNVKEGDIVLFSPRIPRMKIDSKEYFVAKESQLIAIME